jgi:hypothetical protein
MIKPAQHNYGRLPQKLVDQRKISLALHELFSADLMYRHGVVGP